MNSPTVIISGACAGLGLSLTERMLERGAVVYGVTKTEKNWGECRKRLRKTGNLRNLHLTRTDLSIEASARRFIVMVLKQRKRIDILINNAGYANRPCSLEKERLAELNKNLLNNLVSVFLMCKFSLPSFKKQNSGWILNIASMAGKRAAPFLAAYSASKFGVLALSQSIAKENLAAGFKCITVCPGGMNTRMRAKLFGREDAERQQSPDFVAEKIIEILDGKIDVPSGGDVVIRHRQVTAINAPPEA